MWLAGAGHWHFAFAWFFVANGAAYSVFLLTRGEWRRRLFLPRRERMRQRPNGSSSTRASARPTVYPRVGLYNGLQRFGYTAALVLGILEVLSGLALDKPVQLRWLTQSFGGYDGARAVHLIGLVALAAFVVVHVVMVLGLNLE